MSEPREPLSRWHWRLALPLLALAFLTQSYIDLEFRFGRRNLPWVDLCALLLLLLALGPLWRDATKGSMLPLPGLRGYGLFLLASALSVCVALEPYESLHHVIRKTVFFYVVYGIGMAWWVSRLRSLRLLHGLLLGWVVSCASISLISSFDRIRDGDALWHQAVSGLSPNHKAIAVALAGGLPLLLSWEPSTRTTRWVRHGVFALAGLAIVASASKTAMLTGLVGLGLVWPKKAPFSLRPMLVLLGLVVGLVLAYYAPLFFDSNAMLDAARSRHSLNERALEMFARNPLLGSGSGMGVHYEQIHWPHYRVNGVDTHGVLQKIASETGLLGLLGYGFFVWTTGRTLWQRYRRSPDGTALATWGCWMTLHVNLSLSTEALSPTHWLPFAVAWGLSHRIANEHHANSHGSYLSPPSRR